MAESSKIILERATPVLGSDDYPRSREFYISKLGFDVIEEGGDPPRFGIFRRGQAFLFVDAWKGVPKHVPGKWDAYLHVNGLTDLLSEFDVQGVPITRPIENTVYGMREFEVTDPDGNVLCFGEDSE